MSLTVVVDSDDPQDCLAEAVASSVRPGRTRSGSWEGTSAEILLEAALPGEAGALGADGVSDRVAPRVAVGGRVVVVAHEVVADGVA